MHWGIMERVVVRRVVSWRLEVDRMAAWQRVRWCGCAMVIGCSCFDVWSLR